MSDSPPDSPPDSPIVQAQQTPSNRPMPWIEKYRPRSLADVAHQDEVVQTLKRTLQSGNLPHLLFYGPPGTGKTSTILALARELYGPDLWKRRVLELNASNERGIDVIRHKVKEFAQVAVGSKDNVQGYPCPPFKIIILDEADSLTKDAQSALRRTMEQYTKVTRFAILCNYVSRIIEPLTSRCAKFRYKSLSAESMVGRLQSICLAEQISLPAATLQELVTVSEGDMRRAITLLQSAQKLKGGMQELSLDAGAAASPSRQLQPEDVREVAGVIPSARISELLQVCKGGPFRQLQAAAQEMIYSAYPVDAVLTQLLPALLADPTISDQAKAKVAVRMAEAEHKLIEGADEFLQLLDVMACMAQQIAQTQ